MTVIAYRDGILACDSAWNDDHLLVNSMTKIARLSWGALYGAAGDSDDRDLIELLTKLGSRIPSHAELKVIERDINALLITPSFDVYNIQTGTNEAYAFQVHMPFIAIGSGRELAMGAMAAGAGAEEAARIVCGLHGQCRPPIHILKLDDET